MQEGDLQDLVNQLVDERIKCHLQTRSKERSSNSTNDLIYVRTSANSNMQAPRRRTEQEE